MTPEKESQLISKYPKIFSCSLIDGGLACSDGWYDIIDALCSVLQNRVNNLISNQKYRLDTGKITKEELKTEEELQVVAAQVKEKFGGLRFYVNHGDDYMYGMIAMAEQISFKTCEDCGKPGKTGGKGWIRTLCPACRKTDDSGKRFEKVEQ